MDLNSKIAAQTAYTFTRARFDGGPDDGNQINGVPKHVIHCLLDFRTRPAGHLSLKVHHARDQWLDEGNRYALPPYTVLDVAVSQRIRMIDLFGKIGNLMDDRYTPAGYQTLDERGAELPLYFPAAGRNYRFGIRLGLNTSD